MFSRRITTICTRYRATLTTLLCACIVGCQQWQGPPALQPVFTPFQTQPVGVAPPQQATIFQPPTGQQAVGVPTANPLFIPVANQELAWEQIVDVVDDYFRVERENRVQTIGNVVTEGRIDTFPQVGATWLEPHKLDSVGWENRWESTFQTIRRQATLRIIPQQGGYLVDAVVNKELEDLPRPENSTAGAATFRNDNSLPSRLNESVSRTRFSENWIPIGRDPLLEQQLLADIRARVTGIQ